ncbi:LptA/OstA family protein [Xanthobacter sediminis]
MTTTTRRALGALMLATLALVAGSAVMDTPARAQGQNNVPNALQGFARNRDEPVRINADSLEVRDKDKVAVFSGNVVVVQGDTTLNSKDLEVFYDGSVGPPEDGAGFKQGQIRKLEASGGVVVRTKDQTATGDTGTFEMRSNTVTLTGKPVVLTQGPNVIRGQKLVVNLVTGVSRFEGGRVESLIVPGSLKNQAPPAPPR